MRGNASRSFVAGLAGGAVSALIGATGLLYLAARTEYVQLKLSGGASVPAWFGWIDHNLGLSVPVFIVVMLLFHLTLSELGARVADQDSPDRVAQLDHLADIWISLFFGTGVIWTAIGMRNALLFALGDPVSSVGDGAMALLQRMVDGGILVALSTTIVGGVGGYLMRLVKTVQCGAGLRRFYAEHGRADAVAIRDSLEKMHQSLNKAAPQP